MWVNRAKEMQDMTREGMFFVYRHLNMMEESIKLNKAGREKGRLTNAALVTALCVGDLSRQGKPPEERKQSSCCDHSLKKSG